MNPLHILFVCSRNQWRSPTAVALYRGDVRLAVRSAGTSASARRRVSPGDILWADLILVMEEGHKRRLRESFREELRGSRLEVLEIEDRFQFMEEELVTELRAVVGPLLEESLANRP